MEFTSLSQQAHQWVTFKFLLQKLMRNSMGFSNCLLKTLLENNLATENHGCDAFKGSNPQSPVQVRAQLPKF
jgi:hypothetical protein